MSITTEAQGISNQGMGERSTEHTPANFLGMPAVIASSRMHALMAFVERIAKSSAAVLITGESGSGKELVARALHHFSPRSSKPWVDVNCAALPEHLLESELFGYEKGAFSGADSPKPGIFELAHQGTLFLDEIAELSARCQSKLLRVLDGFPHFRLGGTRKVEVKVRIIAATNSELDREVSAGKFRADLFHRLNQVRIVVPPLRERTEDIGPLARFFLAQERPDVDFTPDAIAALQSYNWPGNIRELKSLVSLLAITATEPEIRTRDLPAQFHSAGDVPPDSGYSLDRVEQDVIVHALEEARGHRSRAAELLGISRRTLIRKLKVYGMTPSRPYACGGTECS